jgi:hypothetical protein
MKMQINCMNLNYPVDFRLKDGTHVIVHKKEENNYDFFLTRLNSERHNFMWINGKIEESYETRFNEWQNEAIEKFQELLQLNQL